MRWIHEARGLRDVVLVSLHAHEQGESKEIPAEFIPAFARQMIDAGADLVAGHGPHLLRGMELYKGKPIFYSLSNFIGQNELVPKMPADAYERFRADPDLTPGQVYQKRTQQRPSAASPPINATGSRCVPDAHLRRRPRTLTALIELSPISLGWKEPAICAAVRASPRWREGSAILDRFAALTAVRHRALQRGTVGPIGLGASNPVTMVAKQREGAVRSLPVLCTAEAGRPV